jgi:rRNA-processing protein FCF1
MEILLDTNFILTCVKQKIDFSNLVDEMTDEKVEWIVPQQVLNELGNLKDRHGMKTVDKEAAALSFEILQMLNPKIVELGRGPNVDIGIVNFIEGKNMVLATLDRGLKNRISNKILSIRGKKGLEFID